MSKTHNLIQGSDEWHAFRSTHFGASEASAMLGISPYKTRTDLLKEKATGVTPEVSAMTQAIFDRGHAVEPGGRLIAEEMIGEELFPVTYSKGELSCSCDGITMMEDVAFEHKQWSKDLGDSLSRGVLPDHHQPQAQQILLITGAHKLLFMTSDGTKEQCETLWVMPDEKLQNKIQKGWMQFKDDLENFQHLEEEVAVIGKAPESLPALRIEVTGMVTASNLDAFKSHALAVFGGIKTDLTTDEDFADAEKTVKWCKEVEDRLESAKSHALSQTSSIDELFKTIDDIKEEARQKRLTLEKSVKTRKESIRIEMVSDTQSKLTQHIATLNKRLGGEWIQKMSAPFGDAIKGKKTLASMRDALGTTLAHAKIEANELADRIEVNRKSLIGAAHDYFYLFQHDFAQVAHYEAEIFSCLLEQRLIDDEKRREALIAREKEEALAKAAVAHVEKTLIDAQAEDKEGIKTGASPTKPEVLAEKLRAQIGVTIQSLSNPALMEVISFIARLNSEEKNAA